MFSKVDRERQAPEEMVSLRLPKPVRNALISAAVLLILFVGGGIAYTFFMGPDNVQSPAASAPVAAVSYPAIKPTKPSPTARIGASVTMLSSPVAPGSDASISIKTNAGANCKITAVYNNVASKDPGLTPKIADEFGSVSWTWMVDVAVPIGTWPVTITCANSNQSAVVRGDLVVSKL